MDLDPIKKNNQTIISIGSTSALENIQITFQSDLQNLFIIFKKEKSLNPNQSQNEKYFFQLEIMIQDFIIDKFFKENQILQAENHQQKKKTYQEKISPKIDEIYAILKIENAYKYIFSLFLLSVLNIKKQKLSILYSFFYELLNSVLKNVQCLSKNYQIYLSQKIYQYALYIFSNNKYFFKNTQKLLKIISQEKNIKEEQFLDLSVSKTSKILNSIICFREDLLDIKKIIKLLHIFYEVNFQYIQKNPLIQSKQKQQKLLISNFYLKLLQKMQYKICKKLQMFQASNFDQEDIVNLIRLLLLNEDSNKHALKRYMQIANDIFCGQNQSKSSIKLSNLTNQLKLNVLIKKQQGQQNQGYGILCTIIRILMKNQNLSKDNFFKEKIFVLCLNFIRYKFTNHVRLFSCVIECFSQQMNRTVLIFCLQFLNEQTVKFMSVQKIKSLLKIIAQVANDSAKIKDSSKINKKLFKVKEIIKIFQNLSNKYKEQETNLFFNNHPSSILKIENIDKALSFMFVLDLHNHKYKKDCHESFKIIKFRTSKTQEYQLQLSFQTQTDLQSAFENGVAQLNLQNRNTLQIKILSNKIQVINQHKQYISYRLQNSLQLFIFVSLIKQPSKKYHVGFSIDGAYFQIQDSKNPKINEIQFGSFQGIMKNMYFFNIQLQPEIHKKYIQQKKKLVNLLQFLNNNVKDDCVLFKLNAESEEFILQQKKDRKFFFQQTLKCTYENVTKNQSNTFLDILRQLGGLESMFYLIQKLNQISTKQNLADVCNIIQRIFKTLNQMASLDDTGYFLKNIEKSFNFINQFLFLLLKRNQNFSQKQNSVLSILQNIFSMIIFFNNQTYRNCKPENFKTYKKNYLMMFQIQIRFVKDILCNFELWAQCCLSIQLYVLRLLEQYIKNTKFTSQFIRLDLHKKLIFSTTFYKFQKDFKIQEKITNLCKILYENYLSLPVSQIFDFNQLRNQKNLKLQRKDLLFVLQGCIHRDVNICVSLIYYLLSSKSSVKPQIRTILNLCNYFIQNFIQRQDIFKKINQDWVYVVYQFYTFLHNRQIQEQVEKSLLKIIFCIAFKSKNKLNNFLYYQWVVEAIQTILKSKKGFLSYFQSALNIIEMNQQLFKLPICEFLFQLLWKQLQNTDKLQLFEIISKNILYFSKLIQKINDVELTFCSQYLKFQAQLDNKLKTLSETKFSQTLKEIKLAIFTNKLRIFTKIYNEGTIQKQNSLWIKQFLNQYLYLPKKTQKQLSQNNYFNVQKQFIIKSLHSARSNFKLVQYCSCEGLLRFLKVNDCLNLMPNFLLFHLTNSQRESSNMISGGLISLFLLKQNKSFQELQFICDCFRQNKEWNSNKQDYNSIFFLNHLSICTMHININNKVQENLKNLFRLKQENKKLQGVYQFYQKFINLLIQNCQQSQLLLKRIIIQVISNISMEYQKNSFDEKKILKQRKNYSESISKFCKKYLIDIQKNKKTDIFFKNFIGDIIEKVKYIATLVDQQTKIQEIYTFVKDKTQKDIKFVSFFIERLKYTGRTFLSAEKTLFVMHHHKYFIKIDIFKSPELKLQKVKQFQGHLYTTTLIQKFNKSLQLQKKKVSLSEQYWIKIQNANEFWLHQDGEVYKNQFFELDEKQTGPFGFYKLNIKPVKDKKQKINYPRRKKIPIQITGSEYSSEQCQPQAEIVQVELQDSFKQEDKKQKYKILEVQSIQNLTNTRHRNTLLQPQIMEAIINQTNQQENKQFYYCEYITKKGAYAGKLIVKANCLDFHFISHQILPNQPQYRLSTGKFHQINELSEQDNKNIHRMKIKLQRCQLFTRRYILRHTAIQLFQTAEHKSYFFNLFFKNQRDKLIQKIKTKVQDCIINRKEQFFKRKFIQKWQNGTLSNFQYLMLINRYAGRSTNDLAQYPVLPWVIANYNGDGGYIQVNSFFLENSHNLRRLDYPPGKLSDEKFKKLKNRILELDFCEPQDRFLYGTMFSNPTVLYNFFIRLQPFIQLHWEHQGKRIDHADRLFSGIDQQFRSVLTASSDMKQLTPEFYYWPQFLRNRNQIDLGKKQNKEQVNDVILPVWAKSPQEFIFKMRQVLQSHEVSEKLHNWIDLTFGYKLVYEVAEQYDNLYHYNCYQKEQDFFDTLTDQKEIKSLQVSISQFGQVPENIFNQPHPEKFLRRDILNINGFFIINTKIKQKNVETFGSQTCKDGLMIWSNKQVEFKRSYFNQIYSSDQQRKLFTSKGDHCLMISFEQMSWATLNQGILRVFTKKMMKFQQNIDSNTIDIIGNVIFYAKKSQIIVGQLQNNLTLLSKKGILHGHKSQILYIKANKSLDILLSLDYEGYVMIHQMYSLQFLRGFQLNLQKQLRKKQLRQQNNNLNRMIKVCIHEMGYFIFLVNQKNLLVYTFLGEIFLEQDIELSRKRKETDEKQDFTDIQIFSHQRSLLLLSTSKGNIYMIDFIEIKRFNTSFPYKIYGRIQNNVISIVKKIIRQTKTKQNLSFIDSSIRSFRLQKIMGQKFHLYQIIVQYEQGQIICLYEQKYMGKQLKDNYKMKQIGLFY